MDIGVLEDEAAPAQLMLSLLTAAGHRVDLFNRGDTLLRELRRTGYDLLLIDWQVPGLSGIEVLQWVREQKGSRIPVIFVTNLNEEENIVRALKQGADDYIVKPVRSGEMLARIDAVFRRYNNSQANDARIDIAGYALVLSTRQVQHNGVPIELTQKEFELTWYLFSQVGRLISRAQIMQAVWGLDGGIETRTVDTHMSRLRRKLALKPEHGFRLVSVYNFGYRLESIAVTSSSNPSTKVSAAGKPAPTL